MAIGDITVASVLEAVAEYDRLGRDEFLYRYGVRPARDYVLVVNGFDYPSKAIVAAAHGFLEPDIAALDASDFSGGRDGAAGVLSRLGFAVTDEVPRHRPRRPDGVEMRAEFEVERTAEGWGVTLLSRGGTKGTSSERNPDYLEGLALLLERLGELSAAIIRIRVDSDRLHALAPADRTLALTFPIPLSPEVDSAGLAARISSAQKAVGRAPGASGSGNGTKRIRIDVLLDGASDDADPVVFLAQGSTPGDGRAPAELVADFRSGDEVTSLDLGNAVVREGAVREVLVNSYERHAGARGECIRVHGDSCVACGINFGDEYGEIGEGFIHVHHLVPLSTIGREYELDPVEDLVPVCPNCHAMLHRRTQTPRSVDDLRRIREAQRELRRFERS